MPVISALVILLLVFCSLAPRAKAQSFLEAIAGLKFCRTLQDDKQRLKCFDGIDVSAPEAGKTPKVEADPEWKVDESKSPVDDSAQIVASLDDKSGIGSATLTLRCKEHKTEAIFSKSISFMGITRPIKVLARINDLKPIETYWSPSTNGVGAFAPSAVQFIGALPDDGKLFLRAHGYSATIDGLFKLGKVSEIRAKIAEACKWPADKHVTH